MPSPWCSDCGNGGDEADGTSAAKSAPAFALTEWAISPPTAPLKAGKVRITADNVGGATHELVVIRATDAATLPTKAAEHHRVSSLLNAVGIARGGVLLRPIRPEAIRGR